MDRYRRVGRGSALGLVLVALAASAVSVASVVQGARAGGSTMRRGLIALALLGVILLIVPVSLASATHLPAPSKATTVSMLASSFVIGGISYSGGHTVTGPVNGDYNWTLTSVKGWHIFAVEDAADEHLDLHTLAGTFKEVTVATGSSVDVTFTVPCGGQTFKFYCERHSRMSFQGTTASCL